jgi:hypothetical protein
MLPYIEDLARQNFRWSVPLDPARRHGDLPGGACPTGVRSTAHPVNTSVNIGSRSGVGLIKLLRCAVFFAQAMLATILDKPLSEGVDCPISH